MNCRDRRNRVGNRFVSRVVEVDVRSTWVERAHPGKRAFEDDVHRNRLSPRTGDLAVVFLVECPGDIGRGNGRRGVRLARRHIHMARRQDALRRERPCLTCAPSFV